MALIDSKSSASPHVGAGSRPCPGPRLGHLGTTGRNDGADQTSFSMPAGLQPSLLVVVSSGQRRGCAQCAHPGLRIGSYSGGLGRIAEVFGGVAEIQVLEPGSSPTSGTQTPSSEGVLLCWRVDKALARCL